MELKGETLAFSQLIGTPVTDESGRKLGRVFEVQAHREPDGAIVVDELLVGPRALLKRLRDPSVKAQGIAWASIVELDADRIRVHRQGATTSSSSKGPSALER
jgi:hypothetical protein